MVHQLALEEPIHHEIMLGLPSQILLNSSRFMIRVLAVRDGLEWDELSYSSMLLSPLLGLSVAISGVV